MAPNKEQPKKQWHTRLIGEKIFLDEMIIADMVKHDTKLTKKKKT